MGKSTISTGPFSIAMLNYNTHHIVPVGAFKWDVCLLSSISGFGNDNNYSTSHDSLRRLRHHKFTALHHFFHHLYDRMYHSSILTLIFVLDHYCVVSLFRPFSTYVHAFYMIYFPCFRLMILWQPRFNYVLGQPLSDTTPLLKSFKPSMVKLVHSPISKTVFFLAEISEIHHALPPYFSPSLGPHPPPHQPWPQRSRWRRVPRARWQLPGIWSCEAPMARSWGPVRWRRTEDGTMGMRSFWGFGCVWK